MKIWIVYSTEPTASFDPQDAGAFISKEDAAVHAAKIIAETANHHKRPLVGIREIDLRDPPHYETS